VARDAGHRVVRLVLPRPAAGDAGRDRIVVAPADGRISLVTQRGAAAGARPHARRASAAARLDLHERLRLSRESQSGERSHRADACTRPASSSTPISTSERGQRAAIRSVIACGGAKIRVVQIAGLVARRIVAFVRRGEHHQRRRAYRHDSLRLPGRRLFAGRGEAAGGRGRPQSPARP